MPIDESICIMDLAQSPIMWRRHSSASIPMVNMIWWHNNLSEILTCLEVKPRHLGSKYKNLIPSCTRHNCFTGCKCSPYSSWSSQMLVSSLRLHKNIFMIWLYGTFNLAFACGNNCDIGCDINDKFGCINFGSVWMVTESWSGLACMPPHHRFGPFQPLFFPKKLLLRSPHLGQ